jgi:hypothetical protein
VSHKVQLANCLHGTPHTGDVYNGFAWKHRLFVVSGMSDAEGTQNLRNHRVIIRYTAGYFYITNEDRSSGGFLTKQKTSHTNN